MEKGNKDRPKPPQLNPYVFTILLVAGGLWCFYDGWLTTDPDMLEHATFNRVLSVILLCWGAYDFFKLRLQQKKNQKPGDE